MSICLVTGLCRCDVCFVVFLVCWLLFLVLSTLYFLSERLLCLYICPMWIVRLDCSVFSHCIMFGVLLRGLVLLRFFGGLFSYCIRGLYCACCTDISFSVIFLFWFFDMWRSVIDEGVGFLFWVCFLCGTTYAPFIHDAIWFLSAKKVCNCFNGFSYACFSVKRMTLSGFLALWTDRSASCICGVVMHLFRIVSTLVVLLCLLMWVIGFSIH